MFLSTPYRSQALLLATAFAAGLAVGTLIAPVSAGRDPDNAALASAPAAQAAPNAGHPAEVLRVIDGDTFEARVRIWPGMDVTTKVRLRGIDAPERKGRCASESAQAEAAHAMLARLLAQGAVAVGNVATDKYGGRVLADVSTPATPDISMALLNAGVARRYGGGRRGDWCR